MKFWYQHHTLTVLSQLVVQQRLLSCCMCTAGVTHPPSSKCLGGSAAGALQNSCPPAVSRLQLICLYLFTIHIEIAPFISVKPVICRGRCKFSYQARALKKRALACLPLKTLPASSIARSQARRQPGRTDRSGYGAPILSAISLASLQSASTEPTTGASIILVGSV